MEEKLSIKENAAELLDKQLSLRAKQQQYGIIVLSSATDPYLQPEQEQGLTRQLLEIILKHRFPVHIITKSDLVTRDFDLLHAINEAAILPPDLQDRLNHKAFITFSFSTTDDATGRIFEPGATPPSQRLVTLKSALDQGFHSGVSLMPLLPYISDTTAQLELMFTTFRNLGVHYLFPASITLFGNEAAHSKPLVLRAIAKHYPELMEKYHRFFNHSDSMPAYYREAFGRKMQELLQQYGLKSSII